ncbi:alpha/beta fold hydrolase [Kitasatospora nipponensis]|uniref:Alpha/beta fold hydrolase n=1 Tax=Kitasatospora nipponensis TaxID=258049 RepID=A0ABN1WHT9_9ACTN
MSTATRSTLIRRFRPADGAPVRLACFPHAGGSASYWFALAQALAPQVEVLAVQYPGRQDLRGEPLITDAREAADRVTAELEPWCDRPLALLGHSYGATVAFEVALRMQAAGTTPPALFVSGRRAPSQPRPPEQLHLAGDVELIDDLKRLSGTQAAVLADPQLLRLVLPVIRADYRAAEEYRYRPGPPLRCPVTVLNGTEDPQVSAEAAAAWARHTVAACRLHWFPGGHFYLDEQAEQVVEVVRHQLAAAAPDPTPATAPTAPADPTGPAAATGTGTAVATGTAAR